MSKAVIKKVELLSIKTCIDIVEVCSTYERALYELRKFYLEQSNKK